MTAPGAVPTVQAGVPERVRWVLAYLGTILGLDAVIHLAWDPEQTGTLVGAVGTLLTRGLTLGLLLAVLLFPAAALSLHLAARAQTSSRIVRAVIGSAAWAGWYLLVAWFVLIAGTIGLWPEGFSVLLPIVAGAGGSFGALAWGGRPIRPSRGVSILGLAIGVLIIAGCFVTAGMWGRPA